MQGDFWKYVSAILAAGAVLLGIGRYIGGIETRLQHLEDQSRYLHGSVDIPKSPYGP